MFRWPSLPDPRTSTISGERVSIVQRRILIMQGVKFYDGKPDKYGHTLRYASNGRCVECSREAMKVQRKKVKNGHS